MQIDVLRWRDRVATLHDELRGVVESTGSDLRPGAPATVESDALGHSEPIRTVIGQSLLLCESTSEHVAAAVAALKEPIAVLACFSCVRTATEVASLTWWLLEPPIGPKERVSRSLGFRRKGLDEQNKLSRETHHIDSAHLSSRYAAIDEAAKLYELSIVRVPSATDLVGRTFGDPVYYRLSSAVVHGHFWAMSEVGFIQGGREENTQIVLLRKAAKPEILLYLLMLAVEALARPVWVVTKYVGADVTSVEQRLTATYSELRIAQGRWFWLP